MQGTKSQLKIGCWNSRGLSAAIPFLRKIISNNDIFMLCEHWQHNNRLHTLSEISDEFNYHARASRHSSDENYGIKRGQGGVAIFWRKSLKGVSIIETLKHDRFCGVRMESQDGSVFVFISVYLPASGSKESLTITLDELASFIESLDDNVVPIIGGDFNGDIGKQGGPRGVGVPTKAGNSVLDFLNYYNLKAVNLMANAKGSCRTYEGHNGSSTIDYITVPSYLTDQIVSCYTGSNNALNTSDHLPIELVIELDMLPTEVKIADSFSRIRWDRMGQETMINEYQPFINDRLDPLMLELDELADITKDGIDNIIRELVIILHEAATIVPKSKFVRHLKPYWCNELNVLKREKMLWFERWKTEGRTLNQNDHTRSMMKVTKKAFSKRLRQISRDYHNKMVIEATQKAEVNRKDFWKFVKNMKKKQHVSFNAIKNKDDKVLHDLDDVLEEWRGHFDKLCKPKNDPSFNQENFDRVTACVNNWLSQEDTSQFLELPFTVREVEIAVGKLNNGKTPGHDGITSEHVKYAGDNFIQLWCRIVNACVQLEYIPINFRRGIQVPLYKGKNTCPLNTDNYRGITLLSTFNKLFEALIWERVQPWWVSNQATSVLQGAARKGFSCVHTALTLQETISKQREEGKKVFVAYYDVSKAFDSVWTDGLFFQLHRRGITGNLWRLLYKSYLDFQCCVRIGSKDSAPYTMKCGIHQGGYLSLVKYTAYIDSLIMTLAQSGLCTEMYRVKTSPVGYADDLAACTITKRKMDLVMQEVYQHGCDWRYSFNASKSAVLIFGESNRDRKIGTEHRMFALGGKRVKERLYYDHVGVKTCVKGDTHVRTIEKIAKARKALNASTNVGIRRGGVNLSTCNLIYWTFVIPTLMFGCEIWVLKKQDCDLLRAFQRYAARRLQRFHFNSLNITSFACLGWIDIVLYIKALKVIFVRTILKMDEHMPVRRVFIERLNEYQEGQANDYDSPIIQILEFCVELGVLEQVNQMARGHTFSKVGWKKIVWDKAWAIEDINWTEGAANNCKMDLVTMVTDKPIYSVWWSLADKFQQYMKRCEVMTKLLCHTSKLKADDSKLLRANFGERCCLLCAHLAYESTTHMVMQCDYHEVVRIEMYAEINALSRGLDRQCNLEVLLGKEIEGWSEFEMIPIRKITCTYITKMYNRVLKSRI